MARIVACPYCGKPTEYSPANSARPFCSERCKLIDLGQWAEEKYAIPLKESGESLMEELDEGADSFDTISSSESSSDSRSDDSSDSDRH